MCILDNGKGHIRLQRHQLSVCIGEGDHIVRNKKIFIACIQVILLEFVHFILGIPVAFVQTPKRKLCPLSEGLSLSISILHFIENTAVSAAAVNQAFIHPADGGRACPCFL